MKEVTMGVVWVEITPRTTIMGSSISTPETTSSSLVKDPAGRQVGQ